METLRDEIHRLTAGALETVESLKVTADGPCIPYTTEREGAHTVPGAEVQASAASSAHSLEDAIQADCHGCRCSSADVQRVRAAIVVSVLLPFVTRSSANAEEPCEHTVS